MRSLINRMESEITELTEAGVLQQLETSLVTSPTVSRVRVRTSGALPPIASDQTEFCFGD